jgi:lysophospholipase L1-like esterase
MKLAVLTALFCSAAFSQTDPKSQDWPNLSRYAGDNAKLTTPVTVVFMGDSITDAWIKRSPKFFADNPAYIDRGISGQTTPQMLIRFRPDVIALNPRAVVILAGTNDIAGNTGPMTLEMIEDNYASMAELAKAHGIKVIFCSVMPVSDYIRPQTDRRPPARIFALNNWLQEYCAKNHLIYLDYYSHMLDGLGMLKKEITYDGLHPNEAGYAIMEPMAQNAICLAQIGPGEVLCR